jgi:hypothetical protein
MVVSNPTWKATPPSGEPMEVRYAARIFAIDPEHRIPCSAIGVRSRPEGIIGHRWFTLDELRDPAAPDVAPRRSAALVEELLRDGPSGVAIDVSD